MANHRNRFPARRRFLKQSTALTATTLTATMVALPRLTRAHATGVRTPEPDTDAAMDTKRDAAANAPQPSLRAANRRRAGRPKQ